MSTAGKSAEQPARDSGAPVATQHESIPNALNGLGLREYLLRNVQQSDQGSSDPASDGGQPAPRESADEQQASQRESAPLSREQPIYRPEDLDSDDEPEAQALAEDEVEEQPEEPDGEGLDVDGELFTAEKIRQLIEENKQSGMRLDDYRRKTQRLSRVRQEHEALGQQYEGLAEVFQAKEALIGQVLASNLAQFENTDTSQMSPEEFEAFKQNWAQAKRGADFLAQKFGEVEQRYQQHRGALLEKSARATVEMLKWHEPRWDDDHKFYGQLRNFAVREGLMSEDAFNRETDYLRIRGLIAMMDAHQANGVIEEAATTQRPPRRSRQRPRNQQGQFQKGRETAKQNVIGSRNAKADGSLREMLLANLAAEGNSRSR